MTVERISVRLPAGFDPRKHGAALAKKIGETYGEGFEIDSIDPTSNTAQASRQVAITEVSTGSRTGSTKEVNLARGTKPADGDKMAAKLEGANPGFAMTTFSPFTGKAILTKLDEPTARCRSAVSAAMAVKPWMIQVKPRPDGGFDLELPASYSPSKHDKRLDEVATSAVGSDGWYVQVDVQKLTASIIPSDPPTFPSLIPYPIHQLGQGHLDFLPFGESLPLPGQTNGDEVGIDWVAQAFMLLGGTPGSGKSVTLNACIAGALSEGAELAIVDIPAKSVDFLWCKKYVRAGGWGCDSAEAAVTVLAMVYQEGQQRAKRLAAAGVVNWLDLPSGERFPPLFVVIDEVSGLLVTDKIPTGIPKDHPLVVEVAQRNLLKVALASSINKIVAELRFVGVRVILSTQVSNNNTGISPSLKALIGHKVLQGSNPSKSARMQAFNDETAVPQVPANVRANAKVAKGVGVAEMEGSEPVVYKAWFAPIDSYAAALEKLNIATTDTPAPTAAQIAEHTPSLDPDGGPVTTTHGTPSREMHNDGTGAQWMTGQDGEVLTGYEKANAARHSATVTAKG